MSACSGSSAPGDSSTGGTSPASGGAAGPGAGTGGATGSTGTGGAGVANGSGGGSSPGTGGGAVAVATGGATQGGQGGQGRVTGSGGSAPRDGGIPASSGGATGNPSRSGGAGGKPDQTALPAITVHLAGDSTMSDYAASTTQEGWGQEFGQYFISKVTIDNQALGGANIETFYTGRWKTLINNVKAGDFVFAAFGINDSGTTHGPVTPAAFQTRMGIMADEVAAKKGIFIPTTSSPLQVWTGGKETNARLQPYCDVTIAVGMSKSLLVDDLNARGIEYYNMIGQTAAAALTFNGDKAHFDKAGATAMALLASKELARVNSPLAAYLK
jgi:lysophospholipase L1-like esterase